MVKSLIYWDHVVWDKKEWKEKLICPREFHNAKVLSDSPVTSYAELSLEDSDYELIKSYYFAILHNAPNKIIDSIRQQVIGKLKYNNIVDDIILIQGESKKTAFYRISTPEDIQIFRLDVLNKPNAWIRDKTLHQKGPEAIGNLIRKLEAGDFS